MLRTLKRGCSFLFRLVKDVFNNYFFIFNSPIINGNTLQNYTWLIFVRHSNPLLAFCFCVTFKTRGIYIVKKFIRRFYCPRTIFMIAVIILR